jgi:hypothetical protein
VPVSFIIVLPTMKNLFSAVPSRAGSALISCFFRSVLGLFIVAFLVGNECLPTDL